MAPGILYIHGMPGDRVDTRRLPVRMARRLQKVGFSSLRVDLYASGISDGVFHNVTLNQQLSQVQFLLDEIRQKQLWSGPTIILAFSEAAKIAIHAALRNPDIAALCLWNGIITSEPFVPENGLKRFHRVEGKMVYDIGYGVWLNKDLLSEEKEFCIYDEKLLTSLPIFAVYGGDDALTQASPALLKKANQTIKVVPGADHLFTKMDWEEELMRETEAWLTNKFRMMVK